MGQWPISDASRRCLTGLALSMSLAGCGNSPPLGTVSGRVTLDGQPLAETTVEFQPASGSPAYGVTDAEGRKVEDPAHLEQIRQELVRALAPAPPAAPPAPPGEPVRVASTG